MPKSLTPRLQDLKVEIEGYAKAFGLDCFEQVFEVLSTDELNMVAAYGGWSEHRTRRSAEFTGTLREVTR